MKKTIKIMAIYMTLVILLSGCSDSMQGSMSAGTSETSAAMTEERVVEEKTESDAASVMQTETVLKEEITEVSTDEAEKEPIVLKVCSLNAGNIGFQNGWADKIVLDKFNIKIYYVNYLSHGWEVDRICQEEPDIDIIVWPLQYLYETYLDSDLSLEWDDTLLDEYGSYLKQYLREQIDYVTELSGGIRFGFIADSTIFAEKDKETIWTIGKGSTHPEAAMTLLNWLASSEGVLTCWYGPRGVCWDIDEEGYYYLTELGVKFEKEVVGVLPEEYGGYTNGLNFGNLGMGLVYRRSVVSPDSIHGETYDWTTWHLMQDQLE